MSGYLTGVTEVTGGQTSRVWIVIGTVVLSLLILVPTFLRSTDLYKQSLASWWPTAPIKLGLDLRGGSYLVYEVDSKEAVKSQLGAIGAAIKADLRKEQVGIVRAKPADAQNLDVVLMGTNGNNTVDRIVTENYPFLKRDNISTEGDRTTIRYKLDALKGDEIEKQAVLQAIETIRNRVDLYGVAEPTIQRSGEKRIVVQLPDVTNPDSVEELIGRVARLEFRLVSDPNDVRGDVDTKSFKSKEGGRQTLDDEVLMAGDAVESASVDFRSNNNQIEVLLKMNPVGASTFAQITEDHVGRQLAIVLDEVVQSSPRINEPIPGGTAVITGSFTPEEAHKLAVVLRAGALPAPLNVIERRVVGASLGADSIGMGIKAILAGAIIVIVFMVVYYNLAGFLAVGALTINMLVLLAMLALFKATLTLPGLAGLGLTIGMAVDANIIIYERIREELRGGTNVFNAIHAGFDRAHWTIMDSNLTTLISGVILYILGTGPVKGFAVTLNIGIVSTLFAALVASRCGFDIFNLRKKDGKLGI